MEVSQPIEDEDEDEAALRVAMAMSMGGETEKSVGVSVAETPVVPSEMFGCGVPGDFTGKYGVLDMRYSCLFRIVIAQ